MGEVMGFEVAPDCFDVIEFWRVFGQPFDAEPMGAGSERVPGRLAGMDRAVIENDDHGALTLTGFGAVVMIEVFQKGDEVSAALGFGGGDDQPAVTPVEGAHHRNLPGLPGCRHAKVCAAFRPGAGRIGMGQRLALVGNEPQDVAHRGLCLAKAQPQADTINLLSALSTFQAVPGPPEAEPPFFRSTFESCEREMPRPSCRAISSARRDRVQFRRSSTGADRRGTVTLGAASAFTGKGPGATRALSASTPPRKNHCATAAPYPPARQRPARSARWSSP